MVELGNRLEICEPYLNQQDPACRQYPTLIFSKPLTCDALVPWNSRSIHLTEQIAKQQKKGIREA